MSEKLSEVIEQAISGYGMAWKDGNAGIAEDARGHLCYVLRSALAAAKEEGRREEREAVAQAHERFADQLRVIASEHHDAAFRARSVKP